MAIDERARHELYLRLEQHLGAEAASTLMEHLPPAGWADVATKRDLDHLREVTRADIDHFAASFRADLERSADALRAELHRTISTHTIVIVFATMATSIASVFAAAQVQ